MTDLAVRFSHADYAPTKQRRHVHVPFDEMGCPVDGCAKHGTVPGIKRHVMLVHGRDVYAEIEFPPMRSVTSLMLIDIYTLREGAKIRGARNADEWSREQLVRFFLAEG